MPARPTAAPGSSPRCTPALGGELVPVTVDVAGRRARPGRASCSSGTTAYVESAQAVGLPAGPGRAAATPTRTSSRGVGELLAAALDAGARRVVVGLGGSATNDAGAGALVGLARALGLAGHRRTCSARGGGTLGAVTADDLAGLRELRDRLRGVELVVATDVDVPLLGLHGASAGFAAAEGRDARAGAGPRAGARPLRARRHGRPRRRGPPRPARRRAPRVGGVAADGRARRRCGGRAGVRAGAARRPAGARLRCFVADAVRPGRPDRRPRRRRHRRGQVRLAVPARQGRRPRWRRARSPHAVPTVVVAGEVLVGRRELSAAGITAAYAVGENPEQVAAALAAPGADPRGTRRPGSENLVTLSGTSRRARSRTLDGNNLGVRCCCQRLTHQNCCPASTQERP